MNVRIEGGGALEKFARERLADQDFRFSAGTKPGRYYPVKGTSLDWVGTWTDQGTRFMAPRRWKKLGAQIFEKRMERVMPRILRQGHPTWRALKRALMFQADFAWRSAILRKGLVDTGFLRDNVGGFDSGK